MSARFGLPSLAGTAPDAAAALPIGTQIESHTVLQVLSESRYGFVYLTRDERLGTTRALKEFMPRSRLLRLSDGSVRPGDVSDSIATSVARMAFMSEGNALAAVQHPCLVQVLATIPAHRTLYRVMPLVDGVSLEQHCRSRLEPPTLAWVAGLVDNLLQAMQALHLRGLAHGCVQVQQVMVRESGQALLLGFASVARELDNAPSAPWQSPTAPQRTRHAPPNQADDFPALAATAYFAATGLTVPTPQQRSAGAVLDLRHALSCLPDGPGDTAQRRRGLIEALESGLAPAEESRPHTVVEFRRLLSGEAPLRSVGTEPAPRWVGVVPQTPGEEVDWLTSQPTLLDEGGRALRAATPFAVPVPVPVPLPAIAPLDALDAAGTPPADSASIASAAAAAAAAVAIAPLAAVAATTQLVRATPPSSALATTRPLAEPRDVEAPFNRVEPLWAEPDQQHDLAASRPALAPEPPPAFDSTDVSLPGPGSGRDAADIAEPDTGPFVARHAPRRHRRWPSRALAATVLVAAGVTAAWWYASTPTVDRFALGTLTTPPSAIDPATAAAIAVPAQPAPLGVLGAPAESTARLANTPAGISSSATASPAAEAGAASGDVAATVAAGPPVIDVAPADSAVLPTANASAVRSANANPRTGTSTSSRSSTTAPRPVAARSASGAGSAGVKRKARLRSPLAVCGNRSQFSLAYCLQQQCARSQYRAHPQCIEVRNGG